MTPEEFVGLYERALATQEWKSVAPLVHDDACVTFSNGAVHTGKDAVRTAYEANFAAIKGERYGISNVHWALRSGECCIYLFDFHWSGIIGRREVSGFGRGTSVIIRDEDGWVLAAEHLGPGK